MGRSVKTSYGDVLEVGTRVNRIDNYKGEGKVMAINTSHRPPILVRWPNLEDVWIEADMLTPVDEHGLCSPT